MKDRRSTKSNKHAPKLAPNRSGADDPDRTVTQAKAVKPRAPAPASFPAYNGVPFTYSARRIEKKRQRQLGCWCCQRIGDDRDPNSPSRTEVDAYVVGTLKCTGDYVQLREACQRVDIYMIRHKYH